MSILEQFSTSSLTWFFGWLLIHSVWQATLLWILFKLFCATTTEKHCRARYRVGYAALCFALLGPLLTTACFLPEKPRSLSFNPTTPISDASATTESSQQISALRIETDANNPAAGAPTWDFNAADPSSMTSSKNLDPGPFDGDSKNIQPANSPSINSNSWSDSLMSYVPGMVIIWLLGVIVFSLRPVLGFLHTHRIRNRHCSPVSQELQSRFLQLNRKMGIRRTTQLVQSAWVQVPSVIGIFRPMILLPVSTISSLSAKELDAILLHELAHIRRADILFNFFQTVIETLLFFHPLVWAISIRIRAEREKCCDDLASRDESERKTLAMALFRLEESRQQQRENVMAMSAKGGNLKKRIQRLLIEPNTMGKGTGIVFSSALALLLLACLALSSWTPSLEAANRMEEDPWKPVSATIQYRGDIFSWEKLTTDNPVTAKKIADLFPQSDQGKKGQTPAGWESDTTFTIVKRHQQTGKTRKLVIRASFLAGLWTEGDGDWEFGPTWELRYLIAQLVRENQARVKPLPKAYEFASFQELKASPKETRFLRLRSKNDHDIKDSWLKWISENRPNVEILELDHARSISDLGVSHLAKLKNLFALKLGFAESLKLDSAKYLSTIKTLEVLDISYARGLSDDSSFALIANLPRLKYLVAIRHSGGGIDEPSSQKIRDHENLKSILITRQHPISKMAKFEARLQVVDDRPGVDWFNPYLKQNHRDRLQESMTQQRQIQRGLNDRAYAQGRKALESVKIGKWVVIADGKLTTAFDSFEKAVDHADLNHAKALHRYIFRPGVDDVPEKPFYLSPWNTGSPNWSQIGRQLRFEQKITVSASTWVRNRKSISTPDGKASVQFQSTDGKSVLTRPCVASGLFPNYATVTESDAAELGLFRNSIPGSVIYGKSDKCSRVHCRIVIPGLDIETQVVVFVIPNQVVKLDPPKVAQSNGKFSIIGSPIQIKRLELTPGQFETIQFDDHVMVLKHESEGALQLTAIATNRVRVKAKRAGVHTFTAVLKSGTEVRCQVTVKVAQSASQSPADMSKEYEKFLQRRKKTADLQPDDAFKIFGTIKDPEGNPIPGVSISAGRFANQKSSAGTAMTDENGTYVLEFGPGYQTFVPNDFTNSWIPVQQIRIFTHKSGFYETSFGRKGSLLIADQRGKKNAQKKGPMLEQFNRRLLLKNQPRRVDFVMTQGTPFFGQAMDENGRGLANFEFQLLEHAIPIDKESLEFKKAGFPSLEPIFYSKKIKTDQFGRFKLENFPANVPLTIHWQGAKSRTFELPRPNNRASNIVFESKGKDHFITLNPKAPLPASPEDLLSSPRVRGKMPPKQDRRELQFGKATNGLQAAMYIAKPANHELPILEQDSQFEFQLVVRNVSKETIRFKSSQWRQEDQLIIKNDKNQVNDSISRTWYSGWPIMVEYELRPGEECELKCGSIGIRSKKNGKNFSNPVVYTSVLKKGTHQLQMQMNLPDIRTTAKDDKDLWQGQLLTGKTPIEIQ